MSGQGLLIRGGTVVDGSNRPGFAADVRIRGSEIVAVGPGLQPEGESEIDATGCVVAPGFIDTHTHLDPSLFWDPACDPMPQHGVTTALIGNCSLSLAPVRPEHLDGVIDVFCYIEDMPVADFTDGVPWTWSTWREYRDAINAGGAALNIASLIGHSMLRIYAMGDAAWDRTATSDEIDVMVSEVKDAMASGCSGVSTSLFDVDRQARPVPSRLAADEEFDALFAAVGDAGGFVEFIPNLTGPDPDGDIERLARLLGKRGVTAIWNGMLHSDLNPTRAEDYMALTARLRQEGCDVWPIASPRTVDFRISWEQSMIFMMLPEGWNQVMNVSGEARRELLADEAWRSVARAEWDRTEKSLFPIHNPERARFVEVAGGADPTWLGQSLADLTAARGGHASDVFADWILENDLEPGVVCVGVSNSDIDRVAAMISDERSLISASDAGAHVQMMCAAGDTTLLLTRHVRDRSDLSLEQAVWELTGRQADTFGFADRGRIAPGKTADLCVFDLDELRWEPDVFVADLPSGASRLRRPEGGYRATIVGGTPTQIDGELTGSRPGRVIGPSRS